KCCHALGTLVGRAGPSAAVADFRSLILFISQQHCQDRRSNAGAEASQAAREGPRRPTTGTLSQPWQTVRFFDKLTVGVSFVLLDRCTCFHWPAARHCPG